MAKAVVRHPIIQGYLVLYNVAMFLVHYFVFVDVIHEVRKHNYSYINHFASLRFATALQFIDIIHGLVGITKTNAKIGLLQVCGRLLVLYSIVGVENLYKDPFPVLVLILAYVLIELFRYPYYALRAINKSWYPFSFLRYNAWIILYPIGLLCEYNTLSRVGYTHYNKGTFTPYLPEAVAKCSCFFIAIATVLTFGFVMLGQQLLHHMDKQRQQHFGGSLIFLTPRKLQMKVKQMWRNCCLRG